jgi:sigma-B regulation protein RsbU (phosphoserine phosphatase)
MSPQTQPLRGRQTRGEKQRFDDRFRGFWQTLTNQMELEQIWQQFKTEARDGYNLYARDVDWDQVNEHHRGKRFFVAAWALLRAMLMKLSPARRLLLVVALVLAVATPALQFGNVSLDLRAFAPLILFVLLALELADRVTMKRDLEIAREIQQWLVPAEPPEIPGVAIAFATRPMNTVAGDYYDAFLRPSSSGSSKSLLFTVADVAGKSVPASLLMATFQASLQALAATPDTIEELGLGLNRYACGHSLGGMRFTTAFVAEMDVDTHEMSYINAGHNAPILTRASGAIERFDACGPPFGILADCAYPPGRTILSAGDCLVVFSDGVIEAEDAYQHEYGEQRLIDWLATLRGQTAAETLRQIMADVDRFVGAARQHDDITCLVLKML